MCESNERDESKSIPRLRIEAEGVLGRDMEGIERRGG